MSTSSRTALSSVLVLVPKFTALHMWRTGPTQFVPRFTRPLTDTDAFEGLSVRLRCELRALPEATLTCLKDGRSVLLGAGGGRVSCTRTAGGLVELHIAHVAEQDSGVYSLVASNALGSATSSATLTVTGTFTRLLSTRTNTCKY